MTLPLGSYPQVGFWGACVSQLSHCWWKIRDIQGEVEVDSQFQRVHWMLNWPQGGNIMAEGRGGAKLPALCEQKQSTGTAPGCLDLVSKITLSRCTHIHIELCSVNLLGGAQTYQVHNPVCHRSPFLFTTKEKVWCCACTSIPFVPWYKQHPHTLRGLVYALFPLMLQHKSE